VYLHINIGCHKKQYTNCYFNQIILGNSYTYL